MPHWGTMGTKSAVPTPNRHFPTCPLPSSVAAASKNLPAFYGAKIRDALQDLGKQPPSPSSSPTALSIFRALGCFFSLAPVEQGPVCLSHQRGHCWAPANYSLENGFPRLMASRRQAHGNCFDCWQSKTVLPTPRPRDWAALAKPKPGCWHGLAPGGGHCATPTASTAHHSDALCSFQDAVLVKRSH